VTARADALAAEVMALPSRGTGLGLALVRRDQVLALVRAALAPEATVTTLEQVDDLPVGTVLAGRDEVVWERFLLFLGQGGPWYQPSDEEGYESYSIELPARILDMGRGVQS
jgi:hypothetical protein